MNMVLAKEGDILHVALSGDLNVATVDAMYQQLQGELDQVASLVVDAADVTRVDTSVAQLLFWASLRVPHFQVRAKSRAWSTAWTELGLSQPLGVED